MSDPNRNHVSAQTARPRWTTPKLRHLGTVGDLVRSGGAKSSLPLDGDGRKPRGLG